MSTADQSITVSSCDERGVPGVCQANHLRCARCAPPSGHPFAPGAITRHTSAQRKALVRALKRTALVMGSAVVIGLLAGLVFGAMQ